MFHFVTADVLQGAAQAASVLGTYKGQSRRMKVNGQTFIGTLVDVKSSGSNLKITFVFDENHEAASASNEHIYRYIKASENQKVVFSVINDEVEGILEVFTAIPEGGTFEEYKNAEFSMLISVRDARTAKAENSAIVGIEVPTNIQDMLPFADDLEYNPHVTVAHFSSITKEEGKEVESLIKKAASRVGAFDVRVERSTTFPTEQDDGTYPWVALIKSQGLLDFHDVLLDLLEFHLPGLASTEFIHKNYKPHVTLDYIKTRRNGIPVTPVIWTVDYVTLNVGDTPKKVYLHRNRKNASSFRSYLQVGDIRIPLKKIKSDKNNHLKFKVRDVGQIPDVESMANETVRLVTKQEDRYLSVIEVTSLRNDVFDVYYRVTGKSFPTGKLSKIRAEASRRGMAHLSEKLGKLLDFSEDTTEELEEPEDTTAFGPGSPGVLPQVGVYTKSVMSQGVTDPHAKKFQKAQDLVDRI